MTETCTLSLQCDDRPGLVADVASLLASHGGNIVEAQQFNDRLSDRFFMRVAFELTAGAVEAVSGAIDQRLTATGLTWRLRRASDRPKVLLLVSKFDHCLGDLLYRRRIGELAMDVVGIVSNHPMAALQTTMVGDIPYHHLPGTPETKPQREAQIKRIVTQTGADLVVLARYMQILSDDLAAFLSGRCINIHHSFLRVSRAPSPITRRMSGGSR